jgi:hypothetical protein
VLLLHDPTFGGFSERVGRTFIPLGCSKISAKENVAGLPYAI